ncbi:MAG: hypothetical protein LBU40_04130 [Methanobrevibacter sp.]|jgi:hypothetical protein|nr:hypothetical protein [Methanobrevibacter sp.]
MITFEEFFGEDINYLDESDFLYDSVYNSYDNNVAELLLPLLKLWYDNNAFKSLNELKSTYGKTIDSLFKDMVGLFNEEFNIIRTKLFEDELKEYNVTLKDTGIKNNEFNYVSAIETLYLYKYLLRHKVKQRLSVWKDYHKNNVDFNITPSFKPVITGVKSTIANTYNLARQEVNRKVLGFVYTPETLFKWNTTSKRPCEWCIHNESLGAKPLREWELDHPNGQCILSPVNGAFTGDYLELI